MDAYHSVVLWKWRRGETLATVRGHSDKIFDIAWDPLNEEQFGTVGVKHIKFWRRAGGSFTSTRGLFGSVAPQDTMLSIAYHQREAVCFRFVKKVYNSDDC